MKTNGPGKYDDACTMVREMTQAVAALVIVIEGEYGNGFSVQTLEPDLIPVLPAMLEAVAQELRRDAQRNADA